MSQKYKFFIKANAVTLSQAAEKRESNPQLTKFWIDKLLKMDLQEDIALEFNDLNGFIAEFRSKVLCIKAGGGYVLRGDHSLLMIYRRGFWDLPKGKLDEGETIEECALREVEEECGISQLSIDSKPFSTFHLYEERGEIILKESVWFKMLAQGKEDLIPQTEEDITEARWVLLPVPNEIRNSAYGSIREVIDHFS